jgi:hypothetical protein
VGPGVSTTDVEDDIDGGPPGGCYRQVWQHPPPRLKKTLMVGPLGGALRVGPATPTTKVEEDINGGPLGGAISGFGSVHH